jgi:HEAT repeat protein
MPLAIQPQIDSLEERLRSDDPGVRRVAVLEFADEGEEDLLPAIVALVRHDPEPTLRAEAARALAGWESPEAIGALAQALLDARVVGEAAASSLTELKNPWAGAALVPYAQHEDPFVAAAALRALKELRLPVTAGPALVALTSVDVHVRREAVGVLGWLKWVPALAQLGRLAAEDADIEVRRVASGALGIAAPEDDVAEGALTVALRDSEWQVREEAATTLGKFRRSERTASALRLALQDDHWQVRLRAARSLGRLRDKLALPLLIEALVHPAGNLRKEAAIALGEIGDPDAGRALTAAGSDPDPEVRKAARLALQRLASGR